METTGPCEKLTVIVFLVFRVAQWRSEVEVDKVGIPRTEWDSFEHVRLMIVL